MKLDVVQAREAGRPWYAKGLQFTCTECGNCCTGGPGYVWIGREEIVRLAEHLHISPEQVVERYCRKIDGRFSLREIRTPEGNYDCVFLKEIPTDRAQAAKGEAEQVKHGKRVCSIYGVRPLQCRTWPFWPGTLSTQQAFKRAGERCPGIGRGRTWSRREIEALRDAEQWPVDPPTSDAAR
jgi:Fe-S-cluster containining protein